MAEGTGDGSKIESSVNLDGGTLDMTGGTITVDTFTLESGTLKNLSQFNSGDTTGAELVKTGAGTLNIEGDNTFTGATMINEGTVALITAGTNNIANSSAITVAEGATFDLSGVTNGFTLAAGQALGGDGTIIGDLTLASGALFTFNESDTLAVTGTISFEGFSITDLEGLDSSTIAGTYNLITGNVDSTNISNIGSENAYDLGDGKLAYFEIGSLDLVVVPEPSAFALIMGGSALLLIARRRRR
jgi:autotransporter-associated beta strand protein